jgi:uncharacterized membrane protein
MSNPPPGGYQGGGYPPPGGYQGGGYPPPPGPGGKTQVLGLDYNVAAMLCYALVILCCLNVIPAIIFLVTEPKENRFLRFHALQALLLMAVGIVIAIVFWILRVALFTTATVAGASGAGFFAGGFVALIQMAIGFVFLVVYIVGAMQAYQGKMWKIPVIGDLAEKNS